MKTGCGREIGEGIFFFFKERGIICFALIFLHLLNLIRIVLLVCYPEVSECKRGGERTQRAACTRALAGRFGIAGRCLLMLYGTINASAIREYDHYRVMIAPSAPGGGRGGLCACVTATLALRDIGWPRDLTASYHRPEPPRPADTHRRARSMEVDCNCYLLKHTAQALYLFLETRTNTEEKLVVKKGIKQGRECVSHESAMIIASKVT